MRRQLYWEGLAWLRSTGPGTPITVCDHRDPGGPRRPGAKPCPTPHRQRPLPRLDLTPAGERKTAKRDTLVKELGSFVPQASLIPGCNSDNENTCLERVSQFTNCFYITSSFKPQNKGPSEAEAHCLDREARQVLPSALGREGGTQIQTPPAADRGAAECAALPWQGRRAEGLGGLRSNAWEPAVRMTVTLCSPHTWDRTRGQQAVGSHGAHQGPSWSPGSPSPGSSHNTHCAQRTR